MSHVFRPGGLFQDHGCRDERNHEECREQTLRSPLLKSSDPDKYESKIRFGERYTANWDEPTMPEVQRIEPKFLSPSSPRHFPCPQITCNLKRLSVKSAPSTAFSRFSACLIASSSSVISCFRTPDSTEFRNSSGVRARSSCH
jgi:hypothetical protein